MLAEKGKRVKVHYTENLRMARSSTPPWNGSLWSSFWEQDR